MSEAPSRRFAFAHRRFIRTRNYSAYLNLGCGDRDADLVIRAGKGDEAAFARLLCRYQRPLHRYVQRHIEHPEDTDDVLQQVFISLWRNLRHYDPRRSFKQWLAYIALNKCRDAARRAAVRRRASATFPAIMMSKETPEVSLLREQALQRLQLAIDKLPSTRKEALVLTLLEDHSHSEAAHLLGVTAKAIETRLHHARQQLAGVVRATDLTDVIGAESSQHSADRAIARAGGIY